MASKNWDVVVVGSGPGGSTLAAELSAQGASVLVLEAGSDDPAQSKSSMLGLLPMLARTRIHPLGGRASLVRGVGAGGSSMLYFATAWPPPLALFARYGVDLSDALTLARTKLPTDPLPDSLLGPSASHIKAAALALGLPWQNLPKLIHQEAALAHGPHFAAKWNARAMLELARTQGAEVRFGSEALKLEVRGHRVRELIYRHKGQLHQIAAERVVLAAGGLITPKILRTSGVETESGFFCDPIIAVFGHLPELALGDEFAMAAGWQDPESGTFLSDMMLPPALFAAFTGMAGRFTKLARHESSLTLMVKIRDEIGGHFTRTGGPRKRFSPDDRARLEQGCLTASEILKRAGAKYIYRSPILAAHPGGTVPLGARLNSRLQTNIENLYVCDCSAIPEPWGLPPTLTLVCLGLYLADQLVRQVGPVTRQRGDGGAT